MAFAFGFFDVLVALAALLYLILQWRRNRSEVITTWPFLGMLPALLHNVPRIHDFADEVMKKTGGTLEFKGPWLANMNFIVTSDPRNLQHILNTNFANYPKGPEFREMFEVLGDGIFNVDFESWRSQKKMFQQLLMGHSKFESFVAKAIQTKVIQHVIPYLEQASILGNEVDLQKIFRRLTFDNSYSLAFGLSPITSALKLPILEYQKAFLEMEGAVWHRHVLPESCWKLQKLLQIGGEKKLKEASTVFDEFLYLSVASKREEINGRALELDQDQDLDMVSAYLIDAKTKGIEYSDKFLRDTAFNSMVAGMGSITSSITWFAWLVATHPRVEAKILEEMKRILVPSSLDNDLMSGIFGPRDLNKLVYLHAAFCETMRLYPPLPINHKAAVGDDILPSGHVLKKKSRVLMSFHAMGRSEEIWGKDCLEFKPERWINPVSQGEILYVPPYKFPAFNAGPRTCLGKDMSFVQMKTVGAALLWNFRVQVVEGHPISPKFGIVISMKHGLKIRVSKRSLCGN